MMSTRGCYQLLIRLGDAREIPVGRLGTFRFPRGYYVYTGSARGGLEARVARHLRKDKKLRWHIDYLLEHGEVVEVRRVETRDRIECQMNRESLARPGASVPAPGFGSSDCRCPSHLVYLGDTREAADGQDKPIPDSPSHI